MPTSPFQIGISDLERENMEMALLASQVSEEGGSQPLYIYAKLEV